jgi:hypothetical protein
MCQHLHYTGLMNPGIITIRRKFGTRCANTRTTWDEWGICRELLPHRRGIHRRKGTPPGITSFLTQIHAGKIKLTENLVNGNKSWISSSESYILTILTFLKFKHKDLFKIKNKPDPALQRTSFLSK